MRHPAFILALSFLFFLPFHKTHAAALTVGSGTAASCAFDALEQVVGAAAGGDTITFSCGSVPHTIIVTKTLKIEKNLTIDGGNLITLSGGGTRRIILVDNRSSFTVQNIDFIDGYATTLYGGAAISSEWRSNLTIANADFSNNIVDIPNVNFDYGGGAVRTHSGILTIQNATFTNNRSLNGASGGAVFGMLSNVSITDTTFTGNRAGYGGAFYNDGTYESGTNGYIRFNRVRFENNTGNLQGGAAMMFLYPEQLGSAALIENTEFRGNVINGDGYGGALRFGNGKLKIRNVTFENNTAVYQGGAMWTGETAKITMSNVTMANNSAPYGGAWALNNSRRTMISNTTIVNNQAAEHGGGIYGGGTNVTLRNTIIAGNTAANPWGQNQNCGATFRNGGGNLQSPLISGDRTCATGIKYGDPLMAVLDYHNGAFTKTYSIPKESPAVNLGINDFCSSIDQRGLPRPQGTRCDAGAYEVEGTAPAAFSLIDPISTTVSSLQPTFRWTPSSGANTYRLLIRRGTTLVQSVDVSACSTECSVTLTKALKPGITYRWIVKASNEFGKVKQKAQFTTP